MINKWTYNGCPLCGRMMLLVNSAKKSEEELLCQQTCPGWYHQVGYKGWSAVEWTVIIIIISSMKLDVTKHVIQFYRW